MAPPWLRLPATRGRDLEDNCRFSRNWLKFLFELLREIIPLRANDPGEMSSHDFNFIV